LEPFLSDRQEVSRAEKQLRILILGGTTFIGPAQVNYALKRGHTVTLFNRGRTNPQLFPEVEKLRGDRDNDIEALKGRDWDVVIDNHPWMPRWVRMTAELLKDHAQQYVFVSSISVYADNSIIDQGETGQVVVLEDPTVEELRGDTYGGLKALCEQEAQKAFPGRACIVRPGLIVGPGDRSDRFTYWPVRIDRGGEVLAPGDGTDFTQIIDARDLGEWMIRMVEGEHSGVFNATGPIRPLRMAEMLYGIKAVTSKDVRFTWVDAEFLQEHNVYPWANMPAWVPPTDGMEGFSRYSIQRAVDRGLTFRPLAVTARDTIDWHYTRPQEQQENMRAGISAEKEAEVLAAWHSRSRD
jgi:2'-hydroxyisoflavone reductase